MKKFYTEEMDQFLIENVKGISLKELTERFNEHFKTNITEVGIAGRKSKLNLKSGCVGGRFEKGNIPFNKGIKWDDYMPEASKQRAIQTCFKKGNRPNQYREIGSEYVDADGYVYIKIDDKSYSKYHNWRPKHQLIYEEHIGPVPEGCAVIFADGDNKNFELDNLILASRAEIAVLNKLHLRSADKDITKSGHALVKLKLGIKNKMKELE